MTALRKTIFLVRHGATEDFAASRLQGQRRDGGLSLSGIAQVERLADGLRLIQQNTPIDLIYSSDLQRAVQTSALLAKVSVPPIPINVDKRLREIDFGAWEGLTLSEISTRYPAETLTPYSVPHTVAHYGGESMGDLEGRISALWQDIAAEQAHNAVLVVSHAQALSTLLCVALKLPIIATWRFAIDPASLSMLHVLWDDIANQSTTFVQRLNQTFAL